MTIELITGTPGSGKTCFAVSQRVVSEIGRRIFVEDYTGNLVQTERRVVIAGVRGLSVSHERLPHTLTGEKVNAADIERENALDDEGEPINKRLPGEPAHVVEASLFNWWRWCLPGDLIVCDELQYIVPRGTLGKKPPFYIQAMEIHRHYGIDFLFITQHPDFLDPLIRKLVGLHRHVRSIMGSPICSIYTWDHASNPERFNLANKRIWVRRAKHFKLYKSSVAHVKPPTSGRSILLVVPLLAIACVVGFIRFKSRFEPIPVAHAGTVASAPAFAASAVADGPPASRLVNGVWHIPKLTGCYATAEKCGCIGETGYQVEVPDYVCRKSASGFDGFVKWEPRKSLPSTTPYGAAAAPGAASSPVAAVASALAGLPNSE